MGVTLEIAKHITRTRYSDLPPAVVETTKAFVLDTFGVAAAGSGAKGCKKVVDQMLHWAGKPESTLWFFGEKIPSFHAAMANATMAHAMEFDDTHDAIGTHCHVSVLPAAIAAAEQLGEVSGRELIAAVALGVDLMCRLGLSTRLFYSWHPTGVLGAYGATFAAGKILGLGEKEMLNAIGIAHAQIPGCNRQARKEGALVKRMQPGFSAMGGVLSANLALMGLTGAKAAIEGEHGFFNLYKDHGVEPDFNKAAQKLLEGLGERYEVAHLSTKPYPSCRSTHPAIDGALEIARSGKIDPDDIESVSVHASAATMEKAGNPFEIRIDPEIESRYSIPFSVAVALLRRKVYLSDFSAKNVKDPEVLRLAKKIGCIVNPAFKGMLPVLIELKTKHGRTFSKTVNMIKGHPTNPLTEEERIEKFLTCWNMAAKPLSQEHAHRLIQAVSNIEEMKDINQLTELLVT